MRWAKHFEQVLYSEANTKVEDVTEANTKVAGDRQMPVLGQLTERAICIDGARYSLKEMKFSG